MLYSRKNISKPIIFNEFGSFGMDSMKLVGVMKPISPVGSVQKASLVRQTTERQSPALYFKVKDRVTLSAEAKIMSRKMTPVLMDDATPSIITYEISRPFRLPTLP
jgi:hypothetical protein